MDFNVGIFKAQNHTINNDLQIETKKLHEPMPKLILDTVTTDKAKDLLTNAKQTQQTNIVKFEKNKKKYKVLKKYGEVLQLIEKLLGLIPTDLTNLSVEELEIKLDELLRARKRNEMQLIFTFYQNLFTDTLNNLITIEKDFQEGRLSSSEALSSVETVKQQLNQNENEIPKVLDDTHEEINYLVQLYEEGFNAELKDKTSNDPHPLKESDIKVEHKMLFEKLNNNTQDMIKNISNLSSSLCSFEPQVNLDKLTENLKDTESVLSEENWDVEKMNSAVSSLENTTKALTDEQVEKNRQNENLTSQIREATEKTVEISSVSVKEISRETFTEANSRAEQAQEITTITAELVEDENKLPTSVATQYANSIIAQMNADQEFCDNISTEPNAATSFRIESTTITAEENAVELQNNIVSLEEQREMLIKLEMEDANNPINPNNENNN